MNAISHGFNKMAVPAMLLGMGLLALTPGFAKANINPNPGSPVITPVGGGLLRFDYDIILSSTETLRTNDFFTIYDFAGLQSGMTIAPATFTETDPLISPPLVTSTGTIIPFDRTDEPNPTFTYTGGSNIVGGPRSLGTFSLFTDTPLGATKISAFTGSAADTGTNLTNGNITNTITPAAVPEPGSIALMVGMGISGSAFFLRRRKATK